MLRITMCGMLNRNFKTLCQKMNLFRAPLRYTLGYTKGIQFIRTFSRDTPYQEVSIPVPWGTIRGKWWGPTDVRPVLALHGWQDNCGTFNRLIPLLDKKVSFLAVDFPGHGYSTRLPVGLYYDFTTYFLSVKFILKYFQWPKISLLGHSMGGVLCYTYSMLYPKNVDFVACLDGAKPMVLKNRINYMAKSITSFLKNNDYITKTDEPPSYSIEEIKNKVHSPNQGSVHLEFTPHIIERNVAPSKVHPGKYYFTRDPRIKSGQLLSFLQSELVEHAQNITCPIFISKSKEASYYEVKENFYEALDVLKRSSRDCDFHYVEGTHHAHLNNPEEIAGLLTKFIQKHNIEDRSVGGMRDEMLITEEKRVNLVS